MKKKRKRMLAGVLALAIVLNTDTPVMAAAENSSEFCQVKGVSYYVNTLLTKVGGLAEGLQQKVKSLDVLPEKKNKGAAQIVYSGKSGDLNWSIDSEGVLDISGVGNYDYYGHAGSISPIWCDYRDSIKKVIVNVSGITKTDFMFMGLSNVTAIEFNSFDTSKVIDMKYMFCDCSNLSELKIGNWDTSNVTDMGLMFYKCSSLQFLDIGKWDTSNVTNMWCMFYYCKNLQSLDIGKWNTSNVTDMRCMFEGCENLQSLDIGKWDTSNVTDMISMFGYCKNLQSLDIGSWDTSNVKSMGVMFSECSSLNRLDIGNWDTGNVIDMCYMFKHCKNLQSLNMSKWNTSNVTDMGFMFESCENLQSLNMSNWNAGNVTTMKCMFYDCKNLQSLDIGKWDTSNVTDMISMFGYCKNLQSLNMSNWNAGNVTTMEGMFQSCENLQSLNMSNWNAGNVTTMERMFEGCENLQSLNMSNWNAGNVTDMERMFEGCENLQSLNMSNWNTGNVTNMHSMFFKCSSLQSLDIGNWDTSKVTNMWHMFSGCSSLNRLDIGNWDTGNVTGMENMFYDCSNLSTLDIGNWDTGDVKSMGSMFSGCNSLNRLDIGNWDTSKVTSMWRMFSGCSSLNRLDIGNWDTGNVTDMENMFYDCSNLSTLDIGNWDTGNVKSMGSMFSGCNSLNRLDIGNWDTSNVTDMSSEFRWTGMNSMFSDCSSLSKLNIENWDTSNITNMGSMFSGCSSLNGLDIGDWDTSNVTSMRRMFYDCSSLSILDIDNWDTSNVAVMEDVFSGCNNLQSIDIGNWDTSSVTKMNSMFSGCTNLCSIDLSDLNLQNLKSAWKIFDNCPILTEIRIPKNMGITLAFPINYPDSEKYVWKNSDGKVCAAPEQSLPTKMTYYRVEANNSSGSGSAVPIQGGNLQCRKSIDIEIGCSASLNAIAYGDTKAEMEAVTKGITWVSENEQIAVVQSCGFFNCTTPRIVTSDNKKKEIWDSSGMIWVIGKGEGTTTITGMTKSGITVKCEVTVIKPPVPPDSSKGNGGSFSLGIDNVIEPEKSNDSSKKGVADFFPGSWSLKNAVFPIQVSSTLKKQDEDISKVDSYTIKVAFGIGKSDWLDDDAKWNKYKKSIDNCKKKAENLDKLQGLVETFGAKSGSVMSKSPFDKKPSLSVMGYVENKYDRNDHLISGMGKLVITVKWSASASWQFITPVGPLYINAGGSISAEGKIGPKYDFQTQEAEWVDGSLSIKPAASLEGGYGIDKIATIGASGDLSIPIQLLPTQKVDLNASASVHAYLIFFLDETWTLATYKKPIYNSEDKKKASKNEKLFEGTWQSGGLRAIDTSFTKKASKWDGDAPALAALDRARSAAHNHKTGNKRAYDSVANISTLMSGILPSTLPMQAQVGDKKVMVFQAYDSSRDTLNGTVLKYSVWDGSSWSEPKAVNDTGCSDLYADMKVVNGKLALVWQKVKKKIAGDVEKNPNAVLGDVAANSEIYFATFDDSSDSFTSPVKVTDNNVCDMMPRLCDGTDTIRVAWIRNDANSMTQAKGKNTIYTAEWDGNGFLTENKLTEAPGTINNYVFYQENESSEVLFYGEAGETEKMSNVFGTRGQVIEEISKLVSQPESTSISSLQYADGKISFVCNGCVYQYRPKSGYVSSFFGGESGIGGSAKYCSNGDKNGYLWSTYDSETNTGKLMASMAVSGGYSEPVCIYEKEGFIWRSYSTVMDGDGNWQILANAENCETGLNELQYITKKEEKSLEIAQLSIDENDTAGKRTGLDYCITNTGDSFIDKVKLQIKLADGQVIEKTIIVNLEPGESEYNTRFFDLADIDKAQKVTLQLAPQGQEADLDAVVEQKVGNPNVSIAAAASEKDGNIYITAKLSNTGKQDAHTTVTLYDSATKENSVGQKRVLVAANGEEIVEFTLKKDSINYNGNDAAYMTLVAAVEEGDSEESDNTAYYVLYKGETLDEWVEKPPVSTPAPGTATPKPGTGTPAPGQSASPSSPLPGQGTNPSNPSNPSPVYPPTAVTPSKTPAPLVTPSGIPVPEPSVTGQPTSIPTGHPVETAVPPGEPTAAPVPTEGPEDSQEPMVPSNESSGIQDNDTDKAAGKLKKGSKVTDKKTKGVYQVTSTGKNRTVKYLKTTKKKAVSVTIPASVKLRGKKYKVTSIGAKAFKSSKALKTVKLGKNVKSIGKSAFGSCKKLSKVTIGKNVTAIEENAFSGCSALTMVTIPSKVKTIRAKAFYRCKNLQYIMVKTKKLQVNNVGKKAFAGGHPSPRVKTDKKLWEKYASIFLSKGISGKAVFIIAPVKLII